MSTENFFSTSLIQDNEIVKAADIQYGFESVINNTSKLMQMLLSEDKNFVINGKVIPAGGMTLRVSPIFGVYKSGTTLQPFGSTTITPEDTSGNAEYITIDLPGVTNTRLDTIYVRGVWKTFDNQSRSFYEFSDDDDITQYTDTKTLLTCEYHVEKGVDGSAIAPEIDTETYGEGWVKLAEIVIPVGTTTITANNIKNISAISGTETNSNWTNEKDSVFNLGYLSDWKDILLTEHNSDGTHVAKCIGTNELDTGSGSNQVNGNNLPLGEEITILDETKAATDSITSVIKILISDTESMKTQIDDMNYILSNYSVSTENVYAATTEEITLNSLNNFGNIDGIRSLSNESLILVKNQTDKTKNGLWKATSSDWIRYGDTSSIVGKIFNVNYGNTQGGYMFYSPQLDITVGTTKIDFIQYFGSITTKAHTMVVRDESGHVKSTTATNSNDCVIKSDLLNLIYPVGSIYWSGVKTNPKDLFGGTWQQITDKFVIPASDNFPLNSTGGTSSITLTESELPAHTHSGAGKTTETTITGTFPVDDQIVTNENVKNVITGCFSGENKGVMNYSYDADSEVGKFNRGVINFNNTHSHEYNFSTTSSGSGKSFSILNPYVAKYCWERIS